MQPFIAAMVEVRQALYAAIVRSLLRTKYLLQTILNIWIAPSILRDKDAESDSGLTRGKRRDQEFIDEVEKDFRNASKRERLVALSNGLRKQFQESLIESPLNMLPSFNHRLPTGDECGTYLALDVGGSTFRAALIELSGRKDSGMGSKILTIKSFKIENPVRQLKGELFFDWMATRIEETLSGQTECHEMSAAPLSTGLAWSFPIQYHS